MRGIATAVCVLMLLTAAMSAQQRRAARRRPKLPPLSFTCAHHPDVLEDRPGICPLCKLAARAGAPRLVVDVPRPHHRHRVRARELPAVPPSTGARHRVADVVLSGR